jgi:hypothetical protein
MHVGFHNHTSKHYAKISPSKAFFFFSYCQCLLMHQFGPGNKFNHYATDIDKGGLKLISSSLATNISLALSIAATLHAGRTEPKTSLGNKAAQLMAVSIVWLPIYWQVWLLK